jgi:hypothetical protein
LGASAGNFNAGGWGIDGEDAAGVPVSAGTAWAGTAASHDEVNDPTTMPTAATRRARCQSARLPPDKPKTIAVPFVENRNAVLDDAYQLKESAAAKTTFPEHMVNSEAGPVHSPN